MTRETTDRARQDDAGPAGRVGLGRWLGIGLVVVLAVVAVVAVTGGESQCDERLPGVRASVCLDDPSARPEAPMGDWPVLGAEGRTVSLADHAGDVVVVNFWASWCGPCRREQPQLNEAAAQLADHGVSFLGVNVQDTSTTNALAHEEEYAIPYPSIEDPSAEYVSAFEGVGPQTLPSTVVVDRQGRIAASLFGETDMQEVVSLARSVAEEPA